MNIPITLPQWWPWGKTDASAKDSKSTEARIPFNWGAIVQPVSDLTFVALLILCALYSYTPRPLIPVRGDHIFGALAIVYLVQQVYFLSCKIDGKWKLFFKDESFRRQNTHSGLFTSWLLSIGLIFPMALFVGGAYFYRPYIAVMTILLSWSIVCDWKYRPQPWKRLKFIWSYLKATALSVIDKAPEGQKSEQSKTAQSVLQPKQLAKPQVAKAEVVDNAAALELALKGDPTGVERVVSTLRTLRKTDRERLTMNLENLNVPPRMIDPLITELEESRDEYPKWAKQIDYFARQRDRFLVVLNGKDVSKDSK